ncbi:hypothetical protein Q5P01_014503 [Channa striata]|uniref:Uncharacterized protein n=1 Tax=Channa striata TaxID=64152 RepID=A0AA88SGT3_CHASR|nr:hypothetical protein Q5P01_014503 [Channa striata]
MAQSAAVHPLSSGVSTKPSGLRTQPHWRKKKRLTPIIIIIILLLLLFFLTIPILQPPSPDTMPRLISPAVIMCFSAVVSGQVEDPKVSDRAYVVLQKQNLVTLGSVLAVLMVLMVFMAVCVYKPLNRR